MNLKQNIKSVGCKVGFGMGFLQQQIFLEVINKNEKLVIIDPLNEYENLEVDIAKMANQKK